MAIAICSWLAGWLVYRKGFQLNYNLIFTIMFIYQSCWWNWKSKS